MQTKCPHCGDRLFPRGTGCLLWLLIVVMIAGYLIEAGYWGWVQWRQRNVPVERREIGPPPGPPAFQPAPDEKGK